MDEYISKVSILKDALAVTSEKLKESEVILITLGGLNEEYESFVIAITTRYDPNLTFSELGELLISHEMRITNSRSSSIALVVNIAAKTGTNAST